MPVSLKSELLYYSTQTRLFHWLRSMPKNQENSKNDMQLFFMEDSHMRKFQFKTQIWEEEGVYVSQCRDIEVASCGATPKEALDNLHEAIKLWQKNAKFLGI